MRVLIFTVLSFLSCNSALAAEQGGNSLLISQTFQVIGALFFVLCLIVFLAKLFRKHNLLPTQGTNVINVLSSTTIGGSEKLLLVQIGNDQLILSQSSSGISKIHTLTENIQVPEQLTHASELNFKQLVASFFKNTSSSSKQGEPHV